MVIDLIYRLSTKVIHRLKRTRAKTIFWKYEPQAKIPESMIQKKRELHLSYSQAFGVARITDKFRPRYSAGMVIHLLIAKF